MKKILILFAFAILSSCTQNNVNIDHLPGYWEISKAENEEGKSKEFVMNQNIDYIVLKDSTGFRKKVKPQYSGKFQGSKDVEEFKLMEKEGKFTLLYTTPYDSWKEEIIHLTEEQLIMKNENGITYTYKRYKALAEFNEKE